MRLSFGPPNVLLLSRERPSLAGRAAVAGCEARKRRASARPLVGSCKELGAGVCERGDLNGRAGGTRVANLAALSESERSAEARLIARRSSDILIRAVWRQTRIDYVQ
jgi:hypothetical protein